MQLRLTAQSHVAHIVPAQVVQEVNVQRAASNLGGLRNDPSPTMHASRHAANGRASGDAFAELHPGGTLDLEAAAGADAFTPAGTLPAGSGASGVAQPPRFRAVVVDQDTTKAVAAVRPCAVFIVPQARDSRVPSVWCTWGEEIVQQSFGLPTGSNVDCHLCLRL